jgi:hypothetical protein
MGHSFTLVVAGFFSLDCRSETELYSIEVVTYTSALCHVESHICTAWTHLQAVPLRYGCPTRRQLFITVRR